MVNPEICEGCSYNGGKNHLVSGTGGCFSRPYCRACQKASHLVKDSDCVKMYCNRKMVEE